MSARERLWRQVVEFSENVAYTYVAQWCMSDRFAAQLHRVKVMQVVATAISSGGFVVALAASVPGAAWLGAAASTVALALSLYAFNFGLPEQERLHAAAANALWDVREACKSLQADFDALDDDAIRRRRNELRESVGEINKAYPGTDNRAFRKARKRAGDYSSDRR